MIPRPFFNNIQSDYRHRRCLKLIRDVHSLHLEGIIAIEIVRVDLGLSCGKEHEIYASEEI